MKVIGDLSSEVLNEIFSYLDGDSLIIASNVCLSWRRIVHKFTSLRATKCDSDIKEKLEKCGWIFGEHDFEYCKCIELNTGLFKYIGNEPLFCQQVVMSDNFSYFEYLLSKNKLFAYIDGVTNIFMYDLSQGKRRLDNSSLPVSAAVVQDQTLVIIHHNYRIMVWNHKTVHNVTELNFHGKAIEYTGADQIHCQINVEDVAIGRHKLAVNLLIRDIFTNRLQHRITQIWKLDTDNPSTENIRYWRTIEHDLGFMDEGKLFMNSKLLCLQANKTGGIILNVFLIDDLSTSTTTSVESFWFRALQTDIEEGFSNRIAVFHKLDNILKVYKFFDDNDVFCLEIDLSPVVSMNPGSLLMANFLMGKIMFIFKRREKRQFQCIIVTEEAEVIEGNKQEFQQFQHVHDVAFNMYGIVAKTSFSDEDSKIIFFK